VGDQIDLTDQQSLKSARHYRARKANAARNGNHAAAAQAGLAREVMGMPWATRDELREAIPPAYTEFIGVQLLAAIGVMS